TNTNPPETTACEYGPSGLGNSADETTRLSDRPVAAPFSADAAAESIPVRKTIRLFIGWITLLPQYTRRSLVRIGDHDRLSFLLPWRPRSGNQPWPARRA